MRRSALQQWRLLRMLFVMVEDQEHFHDAVKDYPNEITKLNTALPDSPARRQRTPRRPRRHLLSLWSSTSASASKALSSKGF